MNSNEQNARKEQDLLTPNEAANVLGISRRTLMRLNRRGIVQEETEDEKRHYFSIDTLLLANSALIAEKLGFTDQQITSVFPNGVISRQLLDEIFGPTLYWAQILEADLTPFSADARGQVIDARMPMLNCIVWECGNITGWSSLINYYHDTLVKSIADGYKIGSFFPVIFFDFNDNGEPVASRIAMPVSNGKTDTLERIEIRKMKYLAWYGNVYGNFTPKKVFDEIEKEVTRQRSDLHCKKVMYLTRDFVSSGGYSADQFYCYMGLVTD